MKAKALVVAALTLVAGWSMAQTAVTVSDGNSTVMVTRDPPDFLLGTPGDPVQLPRRIEWTVDGRTILVYPSGPWGLVDIGHFHGDAHVGVNQTHAQGPMLGYATSGQDGTVTGGAVYTVQGSANGSGVSRLIEKVDIHNRTQGPLTVSLTGMGFRPTRPGVPVPDYTGLDVTGTTTVFYQGNAAKYSIADPLPPGYPPVVVRPAVVFSGFNPLFNESLVLPAGAVLTMITELNVKPRILTLCDLYPAICSRPIGGFRP